MSAGTTLYSALAYNHIKVDDAQARVLFCHRMIERADGQYDINTCLRSFEPYLLANQKTEKPVLHVSLNPDLQDVLTDEQLSSIAQEWMQKMGYGEQPFIVYRHEDIERQHIHIVSVRVNEEGKNINDTFEHRCSMAACRELERKYNLVPADQKQQMEGLPLKPVRYEEGHVKHQIANVIRPIAQTWHFQMKEYKALLALYNVGVEEVCGQIHGRIYKGLVYSALNDRGEKVGTPFKSSLFGKNVGMDALEKRMELSAAIMKNKGLKERSKTVIATAMQHCNNRSDFEKALETQACMPVSASMRRGVSTVLPSWITNKNVSSTAHVWARLFRQTCLTTFSMDRVKSRKN